MKTEKIEKSVRQEHSPEHQRITTARLLVLLLASLVILNGWTTSEKAPYLKFDSTLGTGVTVYLADNTANNKLIYDNNRLINISSSTVFGYFNINNTDYTLYFPTYSDPYYRVQNGYNYTNYEVRNITNLTKSNVSFYKGVSEESVVLFAVIGLLFMIFLKGAR